MKWIFSAKNGIFLRTSKFFRYLRGEKKMKIDDW